MRSMKTGSRWGVGISALALALMMVAADVAACKSVFGAIAPGATRQAPGAANRISPWPVAGGSRIHAAWHVTISDAATAFGTGGASVGPKMQRREQE